MALQTTVKMENGQFATRSTFDVSRMLGHRLQRMVELIYGHVMKNPVYSDVLSYEVGRLWPAG
jgi:hypothetical protein